MIKKVSKFTCGHQHALVMHCLLCNFQAAQPSLLLQAHCEIITYIDESMIIYYKYNYKKKEEKKKNVCATFLTETSKCVAPHMNYITSDWGEEKNIY